MEVNVKATDLKKTFNRRIVFQGISFSLKTGETLLITGRNGSGKSTLMKIVARILTPTEGSVSIAAGTGGGTIPPFSLLGFVSPYLTLYDEFSARENLAFALSIRGLDPRSHPVDSVLDQVGLGRFKESPTRVFSSGMKQRLKYAFALIHNPPLLLLDEPMSNLDGEGKALVRTLMKDQTQKGVLIVATNEQSDVEHFSANVNLDINV